MFYFNVITRRFLEMLIPEILLSIIFSTIFHTQIFPSYLGIVAVVLIAELIGFFWLNTVMMRHCYMDMPNPSLYLILNLSANLIFGIINFVFYCCFNNKIFTWFFGVTKFFSLITNTSITFSVAMFHLILFLLIFAAPFALPPKE